MKQSQFPKAQSIAFAEASQHASPHSILRDGAKFGLGHCYAWLQSFNSIRTSLLEDVSSCIRKIALSVLRAIGSRDRLFRDKRSRRSDQKPNATQYFAGHKAGDERKVRQHHASCWCPPGRFTMGSPASEPERRPGEDQVEVTLSQGFWMSKYEATQGQWKQTMGVCRDR